MTLRIAILSLMVSTSYAQSNIQFNRWFENKTLRVDYQHTGTATQEFISLDQAYEG